MSIATSQRRSAVSRFAAVVAGVAVFLVAASSAPGEPRPFYEDRYRGPTGVMDWLAATSYFKDWSSFTIEYTGPCPVGTLFEGTANDSLDRWEGDAGWYYRQDGKCTSQSRGSATGTALDRNSIQFCSDDPFGQVGRQCQTWKRLDPINLPATIFNTDVRQLPRPKARTLEVDPQTGKVYEFQGSDMTTEATGENGVTALLVADALTGGKPGKKLLSSHHRCRRPLDRVVSSESRAMKIGLENTVAGSTADRRAAIAAEFDAQAGLDPALGRCLASAGYAGKVSGGDVRKVEQRLRVHDLPAFARSALKRNGANSAIIDIVRLNLRSEPGGLLKGKLASSLKSRKRIAGLRQVARSLRH
jgi:hypothetical protein